MKRPVKIGGYVFCLDDVEAFCKIEFATYIDSNTKYCITVTLKSIAYTLQFNDVEKRNKVFDWLVGRYNCEKYIDEDDTFFKELEDGLKELNDEPI